jgi:hypothetical protein
MAVGVTIGCPFGLPWFIARKSFEGKRLSRPRVRSNRHPQCSLLSLIGHKLLFGNGHAFRHKRVKH